MVFVCLYIINARFYNFIFFRLCLMLSKCKWKQNLASLERQHKYNFWWTNLNLIRDICHGFIYSPALAWTKSVKIRIISWQMRFDMTGIIQSQGSVMKGDVTSLLSSVYQTQNICIWIYFVCFFEAAELRWTLLYRAGHWSANVKLSCQGNSKGGSWAFLEGPC